MRQLISGFILVFMIYPPALAQELRSSFAVGIDITSKLDAEAEFRISNAFVPETYSKKTIQGKLDYSLSKIWKISGSYSWSSVSQQYQSYNETGEETSDKQKITADLVFQPKRFDNDLKLTSRFRYQYSMKEGSGSKQYLKFKTSLDYRFSKIMDPYIALEPYYNLYAGRLSYIRLYIGNEMTVLNTKVDIYYIAEARTKKQDFGIQYIIGANFKINYADHLKRLFSNRNKF